MSAYLVDTVILSEARRPELNPAVQQWFERHPDDDLFISVLTLGEIRKGIDRLQAGRRRSDLEIWFAAIRERYAAYILPIDAEVAMVWGALVAGSYGPREPEPTIDGLLAATTIVHNLTLVTRNVSDFRRFQVPLENPWEESP